jgi:ribosome biogenesis GTPase
MDDQGPDSIFLSGGAMMAPWGVVVAMQANYYRVQLREIGDATPLDDAAAIDSLLCTRRARLKKIGQQVMVGDRVRLEALDWAGRRGAIAEVFPRQTVLDRPPMANADHMLLVFALAEPNLDPQQLGRFLVKAESTGLRVSLCLNKQDLVSAAIRQYWQDQLTEWGYAATAVSVRGKSPLKELHTLLHGRTTVVSGPSGVGKSSLINRLIPQAGLRTGAVSGKLGRGRHTTRHVELFKLPEGGFLADTPGFNQPDLTQLLPEGLGGYFPEIRQRLALGRCQFKDCLHQGDSGCIVGSDWPRYDLYSTLLKEALGHQESRQHRRGPDAALKVRMGENGEQHHEPRLPAKRYRQPSRRRQKQTLDTWCYGLDGQAEGLDPIDDGDGEADLDTGALP